jgi:hypothetical protein
MQLEGFGHFCDDYCEYCIGELESAISMELEVKSYSVEHHKYVIEKPRVVPESWTKALKEMKIK